MASNRVFNATKTLFAAAKSTVTTAATAAAKKKKPTVKKPTEKTVRAAVGILKPSPVSPALAQFLGANECARTDAVKKIWEHIKLNQLQDPLNKREIICDEMLKTIFDGKDRVGFLEIAKLLAPHFVKTS